MSNNVFIETNILVKLNTDVSLSSATSPEIHYQKPDGTEGEWDGTIDGQYITYTTSAGDIDVAGEWWFQAVATVDGNLVKGTIAKKKIENPIKTT